MITAIADPQDSTAFLLHGMDTRPDGVPARYVSPFVWRASRNDMDHIKTVLPDVDWRKLELHGQSRMPPSELLRYGKRTLWPFQQQLLAAYQGPSLFLADAPALGKTVEAIAFMLFHEVPTPILVVCRASARGQWANEIEDMGCVPHLWTDRTQLADLAFPDFIVMHYGELGHIRSASWIRSLQGVILDEAHAIKDPKSLRRQMTRDMFRYVPWKILSTATPIRNYTADLWPQLNVLDPVAYPDYDEFLARYCVPETVKTSAGSITTWKGTQRWEELERRLAPLWVHRTKDQVGMQLPPKRRIIVPVVLFPTVLTEYQRLEAELRKYRRYLVGRYGSLSNVRGPDAAGVMTRIGDLRRLSSLGKAPMVAEWIADRGEPALVMTSYLSTARTIAQSLGDKAALFTGEIPPDQRDAVREDAVKNGKSLVATIGTGGESLNLQDLASTVVFVDFDWSPTAILQAEDRVHRPGQTHDVLIAYAAARTTIEERVIVKLRDKIEGAPMLDEQFGPGNILELL